MANFSKYLFVLASGVGVFLNVYPSTVSGMEEFLEEKAPPAPVASVDSAAIISTLGTTGTSIDDAIVSLNTLLGGSGTTKARVGAIHDSLLTTKSAVSADLATVRGLLASPPGSTLEGDIGVVNTTLGGGSGVATTTRINNIGSGLDDSLSSLPAGSTYVTVTSIATSGSNVVTMGLSSGTYEYSNSTFGSIVANDDITLVEDLTDTDTITIFNRSGTNIDSSDSLSVYLNSMYPVGSKISNNVSDKIASITTMLGGTGSSVRAKIADIDRSLLNAPTGFVRTDLATARGLLVSSPGSTLEDDINAIKSLLAPPDPVRPTLEDDINAIKSLLGSTGSIYDQLQSFLQYFEGETITFDCTTGAPPSLAYLRSIGVLS